MNPPRLITHSTTIQITFYGSLRRAFVFLSKTVRISYHINTMWRWYSVHERGKSEYLNEAIVRICKDADLQKQARKFLRSFQNEHLVLNMSECPQAPIYHAEGPYLRDHIELILTILYAILEEKLHLIDIEEFRSMKGFEGEIDELEETLKENSATLEVFALLHDIGKPKTITFESKEGSRGDSLGFSQKISDAFSRNSENRAQLLKKYNDLFLDYKKQNQKVSKEQLQAEFFSTFQINIHSIGHEHVIFDPEYKALFDKITAKKNIDADDQKELQHIINIHMDAIRSFRKLTPSAYKKMVQYAKTYGRDVDDFMDLLQACVFLDSVGSKRRTAHGAWHDPSCIINFLKSEFEYAPWRRDNAVAKREDKIKRAKQLVLKEHELDGKAILELLKIKPGPEFGKILRQIQDAVFMGQPIPNLPNNARPEVMRRVAVFKAKQKNRYRFQ